jgi:opacity protein-like surface antigen
MRISLPSLIVLAACGLAAQAHAQSAAPTFMGPGADFSGVEIGLDAGMGLGSAGPTTTSGGIGGAHIGYTLQTNGVVGGVEADALGGSISNGSGAFHYTQDFLTSLRVRGGLVLGNLLGYGTIGWGWSTTQYSNPSGSSDATIKGAVFGLGAEYAITRSVSIRGEVLHYDFGDATYSTPATAEMFAAQTTMLRVGASVHF